MKTLILNTVVLSASKAVLRMRTYMEFLLCSKSTFLQHSNLASQQTARTTELIFYCLKIRLILSTAESTWCFFPLNVGPFFQISQQLATAECGRELGRLVTVTKKSEFLVELISLYRAKQISYYFSAKRFTCG